MYKITDAKAAAFWERVEIRAEKECWPWVGGSLHKFGYGRLAVMTKEGRWKQVTTSHMACYLTHGAPEQGLNHALHSCDNPRCCNPDHLRWGNAKMNRTDALVRGRDSAPPLNTKGRNVGKMPRGESLHNQSLTEIQVREIWRLHLAGGMTIAAIAVEVGAKAHSVADVARGRSWRHLDGAPPVDALKSGGVRRGHNQFSRFLFPESA